MTLLQLWSWTYLPGGRIYMKRQIIDNSKPYGARWIGPKNTKMTHKQNLAFYRNEFDVLDYNAVTWNPYTEAELHARPAICIVDRPLWRARLMIFCFGNLAYHLPDRVMRQFGLRHHLQYPTLYYTLSYGEDEFEMMIELWNNRFLAGEDEHEVTLTDEEYLS